MVGIHLIPSFPYSEPEPGSNKEGLEGLAHLTLGLQDILVHLVLLQLQLLDIPLLGCTQSFWGGCLEP